MLLWGSADNDFAISSANFLKCRYKLHKLLNLPCVYCVVDAMPHAATLLRSGVDELLQRSVQLAQDPSRNDRERSEVKYSNYVMKQVVLLNEACPILIYMPGL